MCGSPMHGTMHNSLVVEQVQYLGTPNNQHQPKWFLGIEVFPEFPSYFPAAVGYKVVKMPTNVAASGRKYPKF